MPLRPLDLSEPAGPTLGDYFGWLLRRWWVLVIGALVGVVGAAGLTSVQAPAYTSTTTVLVRQLGADQTVRVNLDTEAQVIRSVVVANRARTLMRIDDTPESLLGAVSVTVPPNSQVLVVSFEAGSRERARDGSHAFTQGYLDLRTDIARRELDVEISGVREQIDTVNKQLTEVAGRIAVLPVNSVDRQRAEADRNVLTNQLAALNSRLSPMLNMTLDPGSILTDAALPTDPSSPNRLLNLVSGFGAGLLLGIVFALLLDRIDTRVRRGRDLTERLGVDLLLEVPGKVTSVGLLPAVHRLARELGRLRNVLFTRIPDAAPGIRGRRLLVSAASPGAATGFVVGNLAAAYARTGAQVAVLTTNVDSPLAMVVDGGAPHGLAEVLRHDVTPLKALTDVPSVPNLRVLLPGVLDTDNELPNGALLEVIAELAARFDHVLIETGPPSLAAEAQALASSVDGVLLVAEARRSRKDQILDAIHQFEQVSANLLGAVLVPHIKGPNRASRRAAKRLDSQDAVTVSPSPEPDGRAVNGSTLDRVAAVSGNEPAAIGAGHGSSRQPELARSPEAALAMPSTGNGLHTAATANSKPSRKVQIINGRDPGREQV